MMADDFNFERRIRRIQPSIRKAILLSEQRDRCRTTDKYWSGFFVVIFITWIASCQYVVTHHEKEIHPKNESYKEEEVTPFSSSLYYVLHIVTCNLSHLDGSIGNEFYAGILSHATITFFYLLYFVNFDNRMLCDHPSLVAATFLFITLLEHLAAMLCASESIALSLLPSHEKLVFWVIPEALLLIIWLSKMYSPAPVQDRTFSDIFLGKPMSLHYIFSIGVGIPVFVTIQLLFIFTINILEQVVWNSPLFYMIAGGSCYVGFTLYYFGLMVISHASCIRHHNSQLFGKDLFRSIFMVARYHFGTVCYLATLVFPRIHATFAMQDKKLRRVSINSTYGKFVMTHFTAYNYTTMFTIVNKTNFSESLKELLRFMSYDLLINKSHIYYSDATLQSSLLFLLSTNNLIHILLWSYGLNDPDFSLATWIMYLKIMFVFSLAITYLKATSDTPQIYKFRAMLREAPKDNLISMFVFNFHYFKDFDSTDESADSDDNV